MRTLGVFFFILSALFAADATGEWHGVLKPNPQIQMRIKLDVARSSDGKLKVNLYSLDQGSQAIEASNATLEGDKLKLTFPSINGGYEGQVAADGKAMTGTWTQGAGSLPLNMSREAAAEPVDPNAATAAPLVGTWEGALTTPEGVRYRARLNVTKSETGAVKLTVDSIDQQQMGIPATAVSLKGATFHFELPALGGVYEGTVDEGKTAIKGVWAQGGNEGLALDFKKVK